MASPLKSAHVSGKEILTATNGVGESGEQVAELEQRLVNSDDDHESLTAAIDMLKSQGAASISHKKLMNDPIWSKQASHLTFFPTAETHEKFFELLNSDGADEKLVYYRSDERDETKRKQKKHVRPSARRLLAHVSFAFA